MLKPETYTCTCGCGASVTANDADKEVNPTEIQNAITNFKNSLTSSIDATKSQMNTIRDDVENSMEIKGEKYGHYVDDIVKTIESLGTAIADAIDGANLYNRAVQLHDTIQQQFNDAAKDYIDQVSYEHAQQLAASQK